MGKNNKRPVYAEDFLDYPDTCSGCQKKATKTYSKKGYSDMKFCWPCWQKLDKEVPKHVKQKNKKRVKDMEKRFTNRKSLQAKNHGR